MGEVFIGSEALAQDRLTDYELRRWHRPIFRDVYVVKTHELTLRDRIEGAWLRSGRQGVIAGVAASALHHAEWVDRDIPIELVWSNTRPPQGLIVRDETLSDDEITKVAGMPVTTSARTAYDLARHLPRGKALARLDALARATPFSAEDVLLIAKHHKGARGLRRLRSVLPLVDAGAASPRETWLRLLLVDAGLPTPTTQIPVCDRSYAPFAYLDLGWEKYRVAAEYDGDQHRTDRSQYVKDHQRQRRLEAVGWINIRVINEDHPGDVTARVRTALQSRGWRPCSP
ncbi:endonuclease domain-containing protein [Mycobacterium sp. SMC-14]|uniref:endonuclease domain-containing protein n=1 Tax=Mycobacterium sp. SMC-14 TaxID=3385968 RepID=UPI00390C495D